MATDVYSNAHGLSQGPMGPGQMSYSPNVKDLKEASVQDRIAHVLGNLERAHSILDSLENGPQPNQAQGSPSFGLIGGAIECEQQTERLAQRLYSLQARLGAL